MIKQRSVGSTGLMVSEVGFGCGGNAGLMVGADPAEQSRVIAHALDLGITYFDNAPDYGAGAAEENLGRVLKELGARPVVNTKVEVRAGNLGDIAGHIVTSVEESLRRLRLDGVDIVQIHNGPVAERPAMEGAFYATLWLEDYLRPGGVLDGVNRLLKDGKARFAGFISRGDDRDEVGELLRTGLFHMINVPYTLLNPTAGRAMPEGLAAKPDYGRVIDAAGAAGAGIAVFSPLAGGLLTDAILAGTQTHPLARRKDIEALDVRGALRLPRAFQALAAELGIDLVALAYRFVLSNPGVSTLLGGISSAAQVTAAAEASAAGPLPDTVLARIEDIWRS
ncbi:aldo/keto reductase [Pseudochelatococcus sp. B33]